jgi:hypothetical protein
LGEKKGGGEATPSSLMERGLTGLYDRLSSTGGLLPPVESLEDLLLGSLQLRCCYYIHVTTCAFVFELDLTVGECKQRVIDTDADIVAGVPLRATLTNEDVAAANGFTTELLHAKALAF